MYKKFILNKDMAYLVGAILGDGYISNSTKSKSDLSKDYRISLETMDFSFIESFTSRITQFVYTKTTIKTRLAKLNRVQTYYFQLRNKGLHTYLTQVLNLPKGPKSTDLRIPLSIWNSKINLQKCFIAGLFDSDGGIRGRNIGFTMKNKLFMEDVQRMLFNWGISSVQDSWFNCKYGRNYYGLRINRENTVTFLKEIPISNKDKLNRVIKHIH